MHGRTGIMAVAAPVLRTAMDTPMLSKLDAVLVVAWLGSGAMALENSGRVDMGTRDRVAQIRPICHVALGPPEARPAGFGTGRALPIEIDTPVADLIIRCEPS
jgi:hypothetical protein